MKNDDEKPSKTQAAAIGALSLMAVGSVVDGVLEENAGRRNAPPPKPPHSISIDRTPQLPPADSAAAKILAERLEGGSLKR